MTPCSRLFSVAVLAVLALVATGCSSNNKGKIEGKWQITSAPGMEEKEMKTLEMLKAYAFMEFKPDGTLMIGIESSDPDMQKLIVGSGQKTTFSCKYKLGSGDAVDFTDLPKEMQEQGGPFGKNKDRARTKIKIEGDNMTMTDDDGKTGKLVKLK